MKDGKFKFEGKEIDVSSLSNDELIELYNNIVKRRKEIDKMIKEYKDKQKTR